MHQNRPDLSNVDPEIRAYILELEAELNRLRGTPVSSSRKLRAISADNGAEEATTDNAQVNEPAEPPTSTCLITATPSGVAKRTPRHLYQRQRRGGMGIFDLDTSEDDPPAMLAFAEPKQNLLLITNLGRCFRIPVSSIQETPVRSTGSSMVAKFNFLVEEHLAFITPENAEGYLALLSKKGMVRLLRHHVFSDSMKPGTSLFDFRMFGPLVSACWTRGDADLFIATRKGNAIRFPEKQVAPMGTQGIRLAENDTAIGIASVNDDSQVFLLGADGKGAIRLMQGFHANKAPGSGGKIALSTDQLVCAINVDHHQDIFIISRLSKIIRFAINEVPPKEGVVQGVVCMTLRADQPMTAAASHSILGIL